jgi:hypothetical protein
VDETDIRPTVLWLAGLHDDYQSDGRVISEVLAQPAPILGAPTVESVGQCYKQLNSSVGQLGTSTLQASTRALESASVGDEAYLDTEQALTQLDKARDNLAQQIKQALNAAEFDGAPFPNAAELLTSCTDIVAQAEGLANGTAIAPQCSPDSVIAGQTTICTATITDLQPAASMPTGTVSFASSGPGAFSRPGSSCTLAPARRARQASCSVTYKPSAEGSGTHTISVSYAGDAAHPSSRADTPVSVSAARPSVTITAPANGSRYALGQRVASRFTCADPTGPGIRSCLDQHGNPSGKRVDTSTTGSHAFTVTATSRDGQTASSHISYKVTRPTPRLSALTLTPRAFVAATGGPTISTNRDAGVKIRYRDSLAARSTFTVLRCAGHHGRCSTLAPQGTFSHRDRAGIDSLRFSGRLHGHALASGRYVLRVIATLAGQRSPAITSSFVILTPPPVCNDPDHDGDCDHPGQI